MAKWGGVGYVHEWGEVGVGGVVWAASKVEWDWAGGWAGCNGVRRWSVVGCGGVRGGKPMDRNFGGQVADR